MSDQAAYFLLGGIALLAASCASSSTHSSPASPDRVIVVESISCPIFSQVHFFSASAAISEDSASVIASTARLLQEHGEYLSVELSGHANSRETGAIPLSQKRADAVLEALVAHGVNRSRLRAKGYGAFCPYDENPDEEARANERRVEFRITRTTEGPSGVEPGCAAAVAGGIKPEPVP